MKRLFLCFTLALLAILLCVLPAMASFYQEPESGTLANIDSVGMSVTTLSATYVTHNSATLNASVSLLLTKTNNGSNLIYVGGDHVHVTGHFQYGTASGIYTFNTPAVSREYILGSPSVAFGSTVTGLRSCTKYYARFVASTLSPMNYSKPYSDYLVSFLSSDIHSTGMHGLGMGLGFSPTGKQMKETPLPENIYGTEITFTTTGCSIGPSGPLGQGGSASAGAPAVTTTGPVQMSNIVVQSAALATTKAAPGEKVDVTASVTNKGSANGDAKVTLYVNGQEMESQGITVASGQTSPVHFSLSMNEPGTYTVSVGNVPAGSFTVDAFANNDFLVYALIALFTIGIAVVIYMVTRKRTA